MISVPSSKLIFGVLVLVQILFGINYIVSKVIVAAFPPLVWASFRSVVTVILMGLLVDLMGKRHPVGGRRFFLPLIGFSFLGVIINQGCFLVGLFYTTSTNSAILSTLIPIFTLITVILLGREPLTVPKVIGFFCAFVGVLVLVRVEEFRLSNATVVGDLLTIINGLSFGLYLALSKQFLEKHDRVWVTFWMFLVGSFGISLVALPDWRVFEWPAMTLGLWQCAIYAIVAGTFLTYLLNNWVLAYTEASRVAIFIYLQPVVTTLLAWWYFGETITLRTLAGSGFIFAGVYLATLRKKKLEAVT